VSLDELRDDLKANMAGLLKITPGEIRDHLKETLWPFLEALVDVVDEIDDAVAELVDQQEDYLQSETAAVFAALVQSSLMIAGELRKRAAGDDRLVKQLDAHEQLCQQAMVTLGEITMVTDDDVEIDDEATEAGNEAPNE
jgi:hypothetical protein